MLKFVKTALLSSSLLLGASVAPIHAEDDDTDYANTLVIVACRVNDMTGKRDPSHDGVEVRPAPGWKDLELYENKFGEAECKRIEYNQTEAKVAVPNDLRTTAGCMRSSMLIAPQWNEANEGWAVVAVGCPTPIIADHNGNKMLDEGERIIGYKLPECPKWIKQYCKFNESEI
jgi:hypothetical protein